MTISKKCRGYFDFDIKLRKNNGNFYSVDGDGTIDEPIKLIKVGFSYAFSIATVSTTGGSKTERNKYVGQVLTILRFLTIKRL